MKLNIILLILLFCVFISPVLGQYKTGDNEFDRDLAEMDARAAISFDDFRVGIEANYNITEKKLNYLSVEVGMSAGDIYMTVELAKVTGKSVNDIIYLYRQNKGKGWGVIAKEAGVKPGSAEFHAMKSSAKGSPGSHRR